MNITAANAVAVDVKTEQGWVAFGTIKEAAAYLGVSHGYLTTCLRHESTCLGREVIHHQDDDIIYTQQRQAYKQICQEFDQKLQSFFENYKPKHQPKS